MGIQLRVVYIHMVDLFLFYFSVFTFHFNWYYTSQQNSESWLQRWHKLLWSGILDPGLAILPPKTTLGCNLTCCVFESTRCHGRFAKFRCVKYTYAFKENDFCTSSHDFWDTSSSHDFWDTSSSHDFCGMTQFEFVIFFTSHILMRNRVSNQLIPFLKWNKKRTKYDQWVGARTIPLLKLTLAVMELIAALFLEIWMLFITSVLAVEILD